MRRLRRAAAIAGILAVGLTALAGCGGDSEESSPTPSTGIDSYVALGDSYTAAPFVGNDDATSACRRSEHNYPHLLAERLGIEDLTDVSCSGAQTSAITGSQSGLPPQIDAVDPSTDLVTVGIGGNDFGVAATILYQCPLLRTRAPQGAPCKKQSGENIKVAIEQVRANVTAALSAVRQAAPDARIIAVDYPYVVAGSGTCPEMPLAAGDVAFVKLVIDNLDDAILAAAREAGVDSLDLRGPSKGHDVCSDDPWINGVQNQPGKAAALHPFENEQEAVARLLAKMVTG